MKNFLILILAIALCACKKIVPNTEYKYGAFELSIADTAGVKADGKAAIKLVVKKSLETDKNLTVNFSSNKGTVKFAQAYFNGNEAISFLIVDALPGEHYIKAQVMDGTTMLVEKIMAYKVAEVPVKKDVYSFSLLDTAGIKADGAAMIKLQVSKTLPTDKKLRVEFSTTKGSVLIATAYFDGNESVSYLKLDRQVGVHFLTAIVKDENTVLETKKITYSSNVALPVSILLDADKRFYNTTDQVTLQTTLLDKNNGSGISEGLLVNYSAYQLSGTGTKIFVGKFQNAQNIRTDLDGKITAVKFQPDDLIDKAKKLIIEVSTRGATGLTISKTVEMDFK